MTKEGKMRVVDLTDEHMRFVTLCTHIDDFSEEEDRVAWIRESWLKSNLKKGLRVKVAVEKGQPLGFAHCLPIELGAWGMSGKDLMTVPCLTVKYDRAYKGKQGSGCGRLLMDAVEAEAKKEKKGVAVLAYDHDFWFMPAAFFKKLGYQEVARRGNTVIMLKAFEPVDPPVLHELKYVPELVPGKVVVDAFWNPLCMTSIVEIHRVREVCAEYGEKVIFNEFNCDNKDIAEKYQTNRAIFINGKYEDWGYEAPRGELRKMIDQALEDSSQESP
jgi:GNAT superfamily N-acetyltransferase